RKHPVHGGVPSCRPAPPIIKFVGSRYAFQLFDRRIAMFHARRAIGFTVAVLLVSPAFAATIYNNLTPNNSMAMASRPGASEIEAADDFILTSPTLITSASFTGLITGTTSLSNVTNVVAEIYRVFPLDSTVPPSGNVPTRNNSPSDVAF